MAGEETVVYPMGDDVRDAPFEHDFSHLYYRMCRLRDAIFAYYVAEDIHTFVSAGFDSTGIPYIGEVEFSPEKGRKYCERMNRYFAKIPANNDVLPRPRFAVNVTVEYGEGVFERYVYDFRQDGEEYLTEFCQKIRERALYYFRNRTAARYKKAWELMNQ